MGIEIRKQKNKTHYYVLQHEIRHSMCYTKLNITLISKNKDREIVATYEHQIRTE